MGLHLDQKLSWQTHIKAKRRQLELKVRRMNWLINRKSQISLENKITIYKAIIKPVWTYGIELWGCSKPSNTKILQTFPCCLILCSWNEHAPTRIFLLRTLFPDDGEMSVCVTVFLCSIEDKGGQVPPPCPSPHAWAPASGNPLTDLF
jgi:hypothetical protein